MQGEIRECEASGGDAPEPICGQDEAKNQSIECQISLAPLDYVDMPLVRSWRNDYQIWKWCRQNDFISDFEQDKWFKNQANDPSIRMYKIPVSFEDKESEKSKLVIVGVCGFTSIDYINRRAEFSLYIAPAYQGNDLGRGALRCLLKHGFKNLGFHLVWGEVFEENPALQMFEELGFRRDGVRRDFYFRNGKFIDAHIISMKASEWKS